ncbi:pseudouridylate synthase 7 homolog isoform X2 [Monomorium pharaonis]|uniref:pseudouridylate synthase 7 homolog isoform X2 n=1 Tax=Monomorium pharaonis TaxID=307658 RepID=UPI00063F94C7|nr:pseudouridylate synthase 7 homolog isoform X2 [Monomorium pharaonis]
MSNVKVAGTRGGSVRNDDRSRESRRRGNYQHKSGGRGFKRPFDRSPRENAKRNKPDVGSRLKESDIGITEYIGDHSGFFAIIKERYNDFHVNEIDLDGQIAKLTCQNIPRDPCNDENIEDLKTLVPPAIWDQLQVLGKENPSSVEIDVTNVDKVARRTIHTIAKKLANVVSQTVDKGDRKFLTIVPNAERDKNVHKTRKDKRIDWSRCGGEYCHFLLHKVNMDTMGIVNQLAANLRLQPNNFCYAGTKDRRAWTTQWMSLRKVEPQMILRRSKSIRGAYVGNFKYANKSLKLGMLRGNRFRIALRNARETNEKIEQAMTSLRDNGFINYYGLQRFGSVATIPTHEIGKCLLQGKWHEAIELILKPRSENDKELTEARRVYAETKDARAAYAKLKRTDTIEARLLNGLQISSDKNPQGALDSIPRNIRLMYIHAYQSFIWNRIVSRRIKQFGTNVIVGDLVYDKQNCKEIINNESTDYSLNDNDDVIDKTNTTSVEEKDTDSMSNETSKENVEQNDFPIVKILTEEDLSNYTLADVVMPQPGWKVTYPPYAKAWFDEFLAEDGLTTDLRQNNKKYSLSGAYRNILEVPTNLTWKIMHYENKHDDLILSDIDEMKKVTPPQDKPDGKYKALIIEMCLKSSSYATMALREVLKNDTSAETQATLSAVQDAENTQLDIIADESDNRNLTETEKDSIEESTINTVKNIDVKTNEAMKIDENVSETCQNSL